MDPLTGYDKQRLFEYGKLHLSTFLSLNNLVQPKAILTYDEARTPERRDTYESRVLARLESGPYQGTGTGWYKNGVIFVSLQKASRLIVEPRFQNWSHPHYRVDREPAGVVCHEGGHHVQALLRKAGRFDERGWIRACLASTVKKSPYRNRAALKRVTNYEPVWDEAFAESMRLFILNPGLLKAGLLSRYDFIEKDCGLYPHLNPDWRKLLSEFSPTYTLQAEKWIAS
jgi:hypothetical protein